MRELFINGDLQMERTSHLISPGCTEFDGSNQACLNNLCQNGKCVPSAEGQGYECKCKVGYSGPFCDQGEYFSLFSDLRN